MKLIRVFLIVVTGLALRPSVRDASAAAVRQHANEIGQNAILLLDDSIIDNSEHLVRTIHQPQSFSVNPLITADKPWEFACVTLWGTVLYDEQERLFKCWYQTWGAVSPPKVGTY